MADPSVLAKDIQAMLGIYYTDIQFAYSGSDLEYIGANITLNEPDASTTWEITKFTYTDGELTRIQFAVGSWTDRATLF